MNNSTEANKSGHTASLGKPTPGQGHNLRNFYIAVVVLVAAFSLPLFGLVRFALHSQLFSHVILIPFISLFLVWQKRSSLPAAPSSSLLGWAVLPAVLGAFSLLIGLGLDLPVEDSLAATTFAFVLGFYGLCLFFLERRTVLTLAFPLGFLVFMVPFPTAMTEWIEVQLQHTSASAAYVFFQLSGMTFFRQDTYFELPGMRLLVAPECSGIHSTLGLLITSILAGYFFIKSPWKRAVLALVVIPLAIVRNGFRIFVIGELCVRISPDMINSYIHRQGGPIFFALFLVPFFVILWLLMKTEHSTKISSPSTS